MKDKKDLKYGDLVMTVFGKIETVLIAEEKRIVTVESAARNDWFHPDRITPMGAEIGMEDGTDEGSKAILHSLEGEPVLWQGEGLYTIVHSQMAWGYVKMDEEWLRLEPETEYRYLAGNEFDDKE